MMTEDDYNNLPLEEQRKVWQLWQQQLSKAYAFANKLQQPSKDTNGHNNKVDA